MLNSIDKDGTGQGFELNVINEIEGLFLNNIRMREMKFIC